MATAAGPIHYCSHQNAEVVRDLTCHATERSNEAICSYNLLVAYDSLDDITVSWEQRMDVFELNSEGKWVFLKHHKQPIFDFVKG